MRRFERTSLGLVVVAVVLAATAGRAVATDITNYSVVSSAPTVVGGGGIGFAFAICPFPAVDYGGGVFAPTSSTEVSIDAFYSGSNRIWVGAENNLSDGQVDVFSYAVCAKNRRSLQKVTETINIPPVQTAYGFAECPAGVKAISGGVIPNDPNIPQLSVSASVPFTVGTGTSKRWVWEVEVNNFDLVTHSATTYVYCAKVPGYQIVKSAFGAVNAHSFGAINVACPAGTFMLSGGGYGNIASPDAINFNLQQSYPLGQGANWSDVFNNNTNSAVAVQAEAVCAT